MSESFQKSVFELTRRFGLKGDMKTGSLYQDACLTSYSEGPHEVIVHHASGGVRFHDKLCSAAGHTSS